jgi:hypothetical protein
MVYRVQPGTGMKEHYQLGMEETLPVGYGRKHYQLGMKEHY